MREKIVISIICVGLLSIFLPRLFLSEDDDFPLEFKNHFSPSQDIYTFWDRFERELIDATTKDIYPESKSPDQVYISNKEVHKAPRPDRLIMKPEDIEYLRSKHDQITAAIEKLAPLLPYKEQSYGMVTTCGPKDFAYLSVSLRLLRRTGFSLPIEVFLDSEDRNTKKLCENLFPSLNVKCINLSDLLKMNESIRKIQLKGYQFKALSMIFSSFENILFLDADNVAIVNPEDIFASPLFIEKGFITFADFLSETISPYYFQIINRETPPTLAHQSCESGEMFVSKKMHAKTLLLATYYNYYGPTFYYRLSSQNAPGEGDKETFVMAVHYYQLPNYELHTPVEALGHKESDGEWRGVAMAQPHPIDDWLKFTKNDPNVPFVRPMLIHANYPKLDPTTVLNEGGPVLRKDGSVGRMWTDRRTLDFIDYDLENRVWEEMIFVACNYFKSSCEPLKKNYKIIFSSN